MTPDITARLAQWAENDMPAEDVALAAKYEIERLRAGGCARDQGTTQYCAEAAALAAENAKLRAEIIQLEEWNGEIAFNARIFADALKEIHRVVPKHIAGEIARAALEGAND